MPTTYRYPLKATTEEGAVIPRYYLGYLPFVFGEKWQSSFLNGVEFEVVELTPDCLEAVVSVVKL